jgi:prepilin-type N-terminal cleavage/methylation domain-containing protein
MGALRNRLRRQGGFTLIELLVAMTLMAIVLPAVVLLLNVGAHWGSEEQEDAAIQGETRAAIDRFASDLRQAYNGDQTQAPIEAIGSVITFDSPDRQSPFHVRRISYRVSGNQLQRASWTSTNTDGPPWTYPNTPAVWIKQVGSVVSATFTYYDAAGAVTATASAVRTIGVVIQVKTTTSNARVFTYQATVTLRETQT